MRLALFLILVISLSACYKDIESPTSDPVSIVIEVPRSDYSTGITGNTINAAGDRVTDYEVLISGESFEVESEHFFLSSAKIKKQGQLIEVNLANKLQGLSYHYLIGNDVNKVELQVFETFREESLNAGIHYLNDQGSFGFSYEGPFVTVNGDAYDDNITVSSIEITNKTQLEAMASSGYLADGSLVSLTPSRGYAVAFYAGTDRVYTDELNGSSIQAELAEGEALFVYHRDFGYWVEVEEVGSGYISDRVDHFVVASYTEAVYIEGTVLIEDKPVSFANGSNVTDTKEYGFYSTENGSWAQVVAKGGTVSSQINSPCGDLLYESINAAESINGDLVTLSLAATVPSINLSAKVIACDGELADYPAYKLANESDNVSFVAFSNPNTSHLMLTCDNNFDLAGYDFDNSTSGPSTNWSSDNGSEVSYLTSCSEYEDGYSYIKIRDEKKVFPAFHYETINGVTILRSEEDNFRLIFKGDMERLYDNQEVNLYMYDENFGKNGYSISCEESAIGCGMDQVEVTHFDTSSEGWIRVSFSGKVWMQTIKERKFGEFPVSGVILIKS